MFSESFLFLKILSLKFLRDRNGATMVEYGLLVGLISVAALITLTSIGETMRDDIFGVVASALSSSAPKGD